MIPGTDKMQALVGSDPIVKRKQRRARKGKG